MGDPAHNLSDLGKTVAGWLVLALTATLAILLATDRGEGPDGPGQAGAGLRRAHQPDTPRRHLAGRRVARGDAGLRLAQRKPIRATPTPTSPATIATGPGMTGHGADLVAAVGAPAAQTPAEHKQSPIPPERPRPNPTEPPAPVAPLPGSPQPAPEPSPTPPPAQEGEVLFKATFDSTGFSGWYVQSLPGRVTTTASEPFEGTQAVRFEVRDGDVEPDTGAERSEVSGPTFDEGQDIYIRDAIRVGSSSTYDGPWQIVQQLHEENWSGSPGLAVFLDDQPALKLGAGDGSPTYWLGPRLEPDRWYDLVYRVYLSQDPGAGFVEVWLDRVQQTLANGQLRMHGQIMQAPQTYIKAGIYRSGFSTGTSIVEHDAIVIGTSFAAVTGG